MAGTTITCGRPADLDTLVHRSLDPHAWFFALDHHGGTSLPLDTAQALKYLAIGDMLPILAQ
jgi:hypothetical protein